MYRALMSEIRPGVPVRDLLQAAGRKMDAAIQATTFQNAHIKAAAQRFADRYKNSQGSSFGHSIGLEVHDVGRGRPADGAPVMLCRDSSSPSSRRCRCRRKAWRCGSRTRCS